MFQLRFSRCFISIPYYSLSIFSPLIPDRTRISCALSGLIELIQIKMHNCYPKFPFLYFLNITSSPCTQRCEGIICFHYFITYIILSHLSYDSISHGRFRFSYCFENGDLYILIATMEWKASLSFVHLAPE